VASLNITPDATGISYYDEALFIEMMRTGHVKARQLSPIMPWASYRNMNDEDLKAIFAYLRTLKAVRHRVDNTETPTECKLCRQRHGLGDSN
jgi:predicted HAD superfamily phosphohydrolase